MPDVESYSRYVFFIIIIIISILRQLLHSWSHDTLHLEALNVFDHIVFPCAGRSVIGSCRNSMTDGSVPGIRLRNVVALEFTLRHGRALAHATDTVHCSHRSLCQACVNR